MDFKKFQIVLNIVLSAGPSIQNKEPVLHPPGTEPGSQPRASALHVEGSHSTTELQVLLAGKKWIAPLIPHMTESVAFKSFVIHQMNVYNLTFKYLVTSQAVLWTGFLLHHSTTSSHRYGNCNCVLNRFDKQ